MHGGVMAGRKGASKRTRVSRKKAAAKKKTKRRVKKASAPKRKPAAKVQPAKAKRVSKKKPAFNPKTDSANDPSWIAPVWEDDVLLGAHVSIAGGTHEAPPRARAIGASAMQIFTKMANRWADRACESDECGTFAAALAETRVRA